MNRDPIADLKDRGWTYAEIAEMVGVSKQRIGQVLANGLPEPISGICSRCGESRDHLHRHHLDYRVQIVENICNSCHSLETQSERIKKRNKKYTDIIGERTAILAVECWDLASTLGVTYEHASNVLRSLGVEVMTRRMCDPWIFMNWSLPDRTLNFVWRIPIVRIYRRRYNSRYPRSPFETPSEVPSELFESELSKKNSVIGLMRRQLEFYNSTRNQKHIKSQEGE